MPAGPQQKPMFLPMREDSAGSVFLPGLAGDPHPMQAMFPPGTYPIMGSGEYTGTLFPLADPLPMMPTPIPPEVMPHPGPMTPMGLESVAPLQPMATLPVIGIPPTQQPLMPGIEPLASPLPSSMPMEMLPAPPMFSGIPEIQLTGPQTPGMLPLSGMDVLAGPRPLPAPQAADPIAIPMPSGMQLLAQAISSAMELRNAMGMHGQQRNTIQASPPTPDLGQIIWNQTWNPSELG